MIHLLHFISELPNLGQIIKFDVWNLISEELDDFAAKECHDNFMEICNVAVSERY